MSRSRPWSARTVALVVALGSPALGLQAPFLRGRVTTMAGAAAGELFGEAASLSGDVHGDGFADLLAAASGADRVQLFAGTPDGPESTATWTATGVAGEGFGCALLWADVNGDGFDDVVIGARASAAGGSGSGRVLAYHGSSGGPSAVPTWTVVGTAGAELGAALATGDANGDGFADVFAGAPGAGSGAAKLYLGGPTGLAAAPAWTAAGEQAGARFGAALAAGDADGDGRCDLAVGAPSQDGGPSDVGKVYLFRNSVAGLPAVASWTFLGTQGGAELGRALALGDRSGDGFDDLAVGEPGRGTPQAREGRASVFTGSPTGPGASPAWSFESNVAGAELGSALVYADLDGDGDDELVIGAPLEDGQVGGESVGRLRVFRGADLMLDIEDGHALARKGAALSGGDADGDGAADLACGAPGRDAEAGTVEVFLSRSANVLAPAHSWTQLLQTNGQASNYAQYGTVAFAGDVNGDGYDDALSSSWAWDPAPNDSGSGYNGRVVLNLGSPTGPTAIAWDTVGPGNSYFSRTLGRAGDVNGDGFDDVIVGAEQASVGPKWGAGRVYVYSGSAAGLGTTPAWTFSGDRIDAHVGTAASGAGDVNGDGFDDVIVGGPWLAHRAGDFGLAHVFHGSASGLAASPSWSTLQTDGDAHEDRSFAWNATGAGDLNGDGFDDVVVAGWTGDDPTLFAYLGSSGGLAESAASVVRAPAVSHQGYTWFAASMAGVGDVNGDGFDDFLVGSKGFDFFNGAAFLYLGSATGLDAAPASTLRVGDGELGVSVARAGDLDGDGYADVVVGAHRFQGGKAFAFRGGPGGLAPAPLWSVGDPSAGQNEFATHVASGGDVNGDGAADVLVGVPLFDSPAAVNNGRVYLFSGIPH